MQLAEATKLQQRIFKNCVTMLRHWEEHKYHEQGKYPPYTTSVDYDAMSVKWTPDSSIATNKALTLMIKASAELESIAKEESAGGLFKFRTDTAMVKDSLVKTLIFEK